MAEPTGDAAYVPAGGEHYGDPPVDVAPLYWPTAEYEVQSINQTLRYPASGRIIPTIEVDFEIPGFPGLHSILIDNYAFTHADPILYLYERSYEVKAIYALPGSLPPFDYGAAIGTKPVVTLASAGPATIGGAGAIAWAGSVNPRGPAAVAHFEATALGDFDPTLVSPDIQLQPSTVPLPVAGVLGPLDPGAYTVVLSADNRAGVGASPARAVRIP